MSSPEEAGSAYESAAEDEQGQRLDSLDYRVSTKIVRAALAMNNANIPITKANLQRHAWEDVSFTKVNFNSALVQANKILKDTFGLTICELPPKEIRTQGKKKESKTQQFILLNSLSDSYLRFQLESQWLPKANSLFQSELMEERHDYRNNKEMYPSLATDKDLAFNGLALVVVSVIMVTNNHINEHELLEILTKSFGVDRNKNLDILDIPIVDYLKQLDKADYLNRSVIKVDSEEIVEYNVGRRAKAEFPRESFVEFTRIIYNESEESEDFLARINATIDATYASIAA